MANRTIDYSHSSFEHFHDFFVAFEDSIRRRFNVMTPCRVVDYDRTTHAIRVQPLVRYVAAGKGNGEDVPEILCTAWRFSCGNFIVDMPILKGDTGWVIAPDADTDQVKARCLPPSDDSERTGKKPGSQNPGTGWNHAYQHGFFIPDRWQKHSLFEDRTDPTTVYNPDPGRLTIQSLDGQQRISLGTTGGNLTINVNAASAINVITTKPSSSVNVTTKNLNIISSQSISEETNRYKEKATTKEVTANVTINGNLTVNGEVTVPSNDVKAGNVSLKNHVHQYIQEVPGTTNAPNQ